MVIEVFPQPAAASMTLVINNRDVVNTEAVITDGNRAWYWRVKSDDGAVFGTSEGYATRYNAARAAMDFRQYVLNPDLILDIVIIGFDGEVSAVLEGGAHEDAEQLNEPAAVTVTDP